jgi:hypothetical protein
VGEHSGERLAVTETKKRWLRRAFISFALFLTACVALLFALPRLLIAPARTAQADVILHAAMDLHSKSDGYVVDLYRRGVAGKIICASSQVSWEVYPADFARERLISLGVPAQDVLSLHLPLAPCDAMRLPLIVDFVKSHGWKSVLWVGRPESSRYAGWLARRFFDKEGIKLTVSYAPEDREELTQSWWRTHWKVQRFAGVVMNASFDLLYSECR